MMNRQRKILTKPIDATGRSLSKIVPLALAIAVALLIAYGPDVPAMAQNAGGAIGSLTLTSNTPGEIEVSWEAPSLAPSDYRMRWTPEGEAFPSYTDANQADQGNSYPGSGQTTLTLTGLTAGAEYLVQARARYNHGEHADAPWAGPWREAAVTVAGGEEPAPTPEPTPAPTLEPTPAPTPAPTPTPEPAADGAIPSLNLASSEPGQLVITWETPEPAPTDYRLIWAQASLGFLSYKDANESQRANVYPAGDDTTLTLNNLTPGQDYKVLLRARYYDGEHSASRWSGPWAPTAATRVMDGPPAAPTGLTVSQVAHDSLTLAWDDPQDARITGHRVLRGTDADSLSTIEADSGGASTEYTDATVAAGTTYFYAVLALSADGDGAQSGTVNATTPAVPPPAAPTGLVVARVGHSVLTLTWDHPQDERITGYGILRGSSADSLSTITADTGSASTEYEDDTVAPETAYHYAVLARSANGEGAQSDIISATTPAAPKSKEQPRRSGARQDTPIPPVILVSNLSQTANQNATYDRDHGQAFTTGSNSTGYTVTSVTIVSKDPNADAIPLQICEVDGSVHPTTVCTDLTPPSSYPQGNLTYTAPTSPALTLDADTTYMLVFKAPPAIRVAARGRHQQRKTKTPPPLRASQLPTHSSGTTPATPG